MNNECETNLAVEEKLKLWGVTLKPHYTGETNWEGMRADSFTVVMGRDYTQTFNYYMGLGHRDPKTKTYRLPDSASILYCLVLDSRAADYDLEEFMSEFGYENKNKAKSILRACKDIKNKLRVILKPKMIEELEELLQDY